MDLKYSTQGSTRNDEVGDSYPLKEIDEIRSLKIGDDNQKGEGEISSPVTGVYYQEREDEISPPETGDYYEESEDQKSPPESRDNNLESEGELSPPETGENGCSVRENKDDNSPGKSGEDSISIESPGKSRKKKISFESPGKSGKKSTSSEKTGKKSTTSSKRPEKSEKKNTSSKSPAGKSGKKSISSESSEKSGKKTTSSENGNPKQPLNHRKATIMVAGKPRNGKSTALNNIFGTTMTSFTSATSVTQVVTEREVTRKVPLPKPEEKAADGKTTDTKATDGKATDGKEQEITLRVIDTPGLGDPNIPKNKILKNMKKITQGEHYILIYCFSVSPGNSITETDANIVKNLQQSLGKEIWKKCVLLFTFSDCAQIHNSRTYVTHIQDHATEFQKILNKIDQTNSIVVKTIFDYRSPEQLEQDKNPSEIIAIPVNNDPPNSTDILPGMLRKGQKWTEIVFGELMKRTSEEERTSFTTFAYPNLVLGTSTAGVGAVVGGVIGGVVGALGGPLGVGAGAAVGAGVGAAATSATAFAVKGAISFVSWMRK